MVCHSLTALHSTLSIAYNINIQLYFSFVDDTQKNFVKLMSSIKQTSMFVKIQTSFLTSHFLGKINDTKFRY